MSGVLRLEQCMNWSASRVTRAGLSMHHLFQSDLSGSGKFFSESKAGFLNL